MKKNVLIVDDEPSIRLILEYYLGLNFQVFAKTNGKEALEWLQEGHAVDIIIADYSMPLMTGLELVSAIRCFDKFQHIPLIVLSGKEESEEKNRCLKAGANAYMIKPFKPADVESRINSLLEQVNA